MEIINALLDESKWFFVAILIAILFLTIFLVSTFPKSALWKRKIPLLMNLMFGITMSVMAFGHLFAVVAKEMMGSLDGSRLLFYTIGVVLALPSWWLMAYSIQAIRKGTYQRRKSIGLNIWLSSTLLLLGIVNLPLSLPGVLNILYQWIDVKRVRLILLILFCALYMFLFIGSAIFFMSGQTFEQFEGME